MPIYQYKCTECEELLEVQQSFTEDTLTELDGCSIKPGTHQLKKIFSSPAIAFKGDGFYKNDARSNSSSSKTTKPLEKSTETSSSDSKPTETKPTVSDTKATKSDSKKTADTSSS